MRVKVLLGKVGLVIPCGKATDKVERLLADVANRFESHGIKVGELRIAQLQTEDGFLLHPNDRIEEVISDGDRLVALDYDEWIEKEVKLCGKEWLSVIQEDYQDSVYKWVSVGLHEHNKLYVKFGLNWPTAKNSKLLRLELFDTESLQHFAKEGKVLIGCKENVEANWKIEAYFNIEKSIAKEVELSVKSSSDALPVIKKIKIETNGRKLAPGEITVIQNDIDVLDLGGVEYTIPNTVRSGGVLEEPPALKISTPTPNKSTGNCPVEATQKGEVEPDQSWFSNDGYNNIFYCNFDLINKSSEVVAITSVKAAYLARDGQWIDVQSNTGQRYGFYNYSMQRDTKFNMEPLKQQELAVSAIIPIKAPQFDRLRRAHKSLPQPLKIKITFEDSQGRTSTIMVEQINKPHDVVNLAKIEKNAGRQSLFYIDCDDTEMEHRIWGEVFPGSDSNERIEIRVNPNQGNYFYRSTFKKLVWNAINENKAEYVTDATYDKAGCTATVSVLVDLKRAKAYALKFDLKTTTGQSVGYYRLPHLPQKE